MKFRTILSHLLGLWGHAFRAPGISRPMPSLYGRKAFRIAGFSIPALVFLLLACGKPSGHRGAQQPGKVAMSREDSLKIASEIEHATPENHARTMELIFGKPKYAIRNIGILVYDGVNDLDLMGPRYVLGQAMGANTKLIGIKPGHIQTVMGVEIVPETVIDSVTQLDILIIPGGFQGTIEAAYNKPLHDWIRKKYKALPANQRYTQDGKYWTSAGVTAGMDMSLAIMKDIYGDRYAQAIMLDMEYDPLPPIEGGTPDKTNWAVRWMMKAMYDGGVNPLIHRLENKK